MSLVQTTVRRCGAKPHTRRLVSRAQRVGGWSIPQLRAQPDHFSYDETPLGAIPGARRQPRCESGPKVRILIGGKDQGAENAGPLVAGPPPPGPWSPGPSRRPGSQRPTRRFWVQTGELVSIKYAKSTQSSPSVEKEPVLLHVCSPLVAEYLPASTFCHVLRSRLLWGRHRGTARDGGPGGVYTARTRRTQR